MSIADRIRELAAESGAAPAESLASSEIVAFELRPDGGLLLLTAAGETIESAGLHADVRPEDRAAHRALYADLLAHLALLIPGGRVLAGIRYQRRVIRLSDGRTDAIFSEAGR